MQDEYFRNSFFSLSYDPQARLMTAFKRKHWMPQNSNAVLPAAKPPLSPALSDPRASGVLQLRPRQSTSSSTASFSAIKHLIPSISTLNFPNAVLPDNSSAITVSTYNGTFAEDDPPVFDCEDAKDDDDTVSLEETRSNAIRPVQILTERLEAWHMLIKQLHDHFTELANVETQLSKAYAKLSRPVGLFDQANTVLDTHFNYPQGIRSVCQLWQGRHADLEKGHATLGTFLKCTVLPSLNNMKRELKNMIRSVYMDDRLKLSKLSRLRREAKRRVMRLDRQLAFFDQHPHHGDGKQDPWLLNAAVINQMLKVYHQTNKMHETILRLQKEVMISEQRIVQEFRQLCEDIAQVVREQTTLGIDPGLEKVMQMVEQLKANGDWDDFVDRFKEHLIPENARFRHPNQLQYPNHAHPLLQPVFAARMERNSSLLHRWHEHIYVLTPAGFLHEYRNPKTYPNRPDSTIFVPHYNVSTLSTNLHHNLIFQLQPRQQGNVMSYSPSSTSSLASYASSPREQRTRSYKTLTFRAKSAPDMQVWLEHLTELSYRYRPSVSYSAPPFLQPSNATKPEYFVASPSPADSTSLAEKKTDPEPSAAEQSSEVSNSSETKEEPTEKDAENSWCQENPWKDDSSKSEAFPAMEDQSGAGPSLISGCIVSVDPPAPSAPDKDTAEKELKEEEEKSEEKKDDEPKQEEQKEEQEEEEAPRTFFLAGVTLPDSMQ